MPDLFYSQGVRVWRAGKLHGGIVVAGRCRHEEVVLAEADKALRESRKSHLRRLT